MDCTAYPASNSASRPMPQVESAGIVGGLTTVVVMLQLLVAVPAAESETLAPKVLPPPVGVPVTAPVEAFRFKPGGSAPVENV